eukprot:s3946_g8.t1
MPLAPSQISSLREGRNQGINRELMRLKHVSCSAVVLRIVCTARGWLTSSYISRCKTTFSCESQLLATCDDRLAWPQPHCVNFGCKVSSEFTGWMLRSSAPRCKTQRRDESTIARSGMLCCTALLPCEGSLGPTTWLSPLMPWSCVFSLVCEAVRLGGVARFRLAACSAIAAVGPGLP